MVHGPHQDDLLVGPSILQYLVSRSEDHANPTCCMNFWNPSQTSLCRVRKGAVLVGGTSSLSLSPRHPGICTQEVAQVKGGDHIPQANALWNLSQATSHTPCKAAGNANGSGKGPSSPISLCSPSGCSAGCRGLCCACSGNTRCKGRCPG